MRVLLTGHAGMLVHAGGSTILCDPWFTPAYFGSWFPFPDNSGVDVEAISSPDYLYVSHLHKDHFDARFLSEHVSTSATVLLPDFPFDDLQASFERLGFRRFVQTRSGQPVDLDGFRAAIVSSTSVSDGPIGDSAIAIDDGEATILDQNDCHPRDAGALMTLAPYDLHFLQYSGAIWYPMVYRWDPDEKAELCREKRLRQLARTLRYIESVGADHVVPFAGPPAFLDEALFGLNDLDDDPANIFQDQASFLRALDVHGVHHGHLAVGGSTVEVRHGHFEISPPGTQEELEAIFTDKRRYLRAYQERRRADVAAAMPSDPGTDRDPGTLVDAMARWIEPLLAGAPAVRSALGGPIVLDVGRFGVVIDPAEGAVRRWQGEEPDHYFAFDESLLWSLVDRHVPDWVNELFLSCRFEATRREGYNETVFSFFKCLAPHNMQYLESTLRTDDQPLVAEPAPVEEDLWQCGEFMVQRHCPHRGADLSCFGELEDGVLTCTLHGRSFELLTGRCLNADGPGIYTVPVGPDEASVGAMSDKAQPEFAD